MKENEINLKSKMEKKKKNKENPTLYMKAHEWDKIEKYRLSAFNATCTHCGAIHFEEERVGNKTTFIDCCKHGDITLQSLGHLYPEELRKILLERKNSFLNNIRSINGNFAMASLSIKQYEFKTKGPYCFRIFGQIYRHFDTAAIPEANCEPKGGQLYFFDTNDALELRQNKLCADPEDIKTIHNYLIKNNAYAKSYIMMREEMDRQQAIAIRNNETVKKVTLLFNSTTDHDKRRYNKPTNNEVAVVFVPTEDGNVPQAHITVHERGKEVKTLQHIDPNVEPMLYPVLRPNGEQTWHVNMKTNSGKKISHCDYTNHQLHYRQGKNERYEFNPLHYSGKLAQQYFVERWCCVETERLLYLRLNQNKIKASSYTGLQDWLSNAANEKNATIGRQVILPSSYYGGPRYMLNSYNDAMCICAEFGVPDLFITMTCDPANEDIVQNIPKGDTSNNHPMIGCRVFNQHCKKLLELLNCRDKTKGGIFGHALAYCYTIEFQKRGLPHMHLLLTLDGAGKKYLRENVDKILSATVCLCGDENCPINKKMVHGPCGKNNPNAPCMKIILCRSCKFKSNNDRPKDCEHCDKLGKFCSKGFPKEFRETTETKNNGYVQLRRPANQTVTIGSRKIDNSMIVAHSPFLVKTFGAHINVEIVNNVRAVKYIYKYIHKGYDAAVVDMVKVTDDGQLIYDEINKHLDARYVGPYEATWHLMKYRIQNKSHHVESLPVHLENRQTVYFNDDATKDQMANTLEKNTKLTAFFEYCNAHPEEKLLYADFPKTKTWVKNQWKMRKSYFNTLGRMYTVSPADGELFYLRILLNNVSGPKSFADLYEYENQKYDSYAKACLARNLIADNDEYKKILEEACLSKFPKRIRSLFALLLIHCNPPTPEELWEAFKINMAEDFMMKYKNQQIACDLAYANILKKISNYGKNMQQDFPSMPTIDLNQLSQEKSKYDKNAHLEIAEEMANKMNDKQKNIYVKIKVLLENSIINEENKCFFIDGPGGTGKTYIYKAIYHLVVSMEKKVECTAFSGIAATLLPKGKTNHNLLKLPVPITSESISRLDPNSDEGKYLKEVDIIIWDEAPMSPKYVLEICDKKLREITNIQKPFGGKIMLLGGDFRQILPVKRNSLHYSEIIDLSIKFSSLWKEFQVIKLTENMRADPNAIEFAKDILNIGNGSINDNKDMIKFPKESITENWLHEEIFGYFIQNQDWNGMSKCAILAARNSDVDLHNLLVLNKLNSKSKTYVSIDHADNWKGPPLPNEILNKFETSNFSPPKLTLKENAIIILLRNLNINKGLCNGTRMRVLKMGERLLTCEIITGDKCGKIVFIPKITIIDDINFSCELHRHQFPVKLAFAMTINKSQGQTFSKIGIDLRHDVFSHGQLYVAVSRASSWEDIKIRLPTDVTKAKNVVWKEIFD